MSENDLSFIIRGCIFKVYNSLGPGLLESAYEAALAHEIEKAGLSVGRQVGLPMIYDGVKVDVGYRMDLVVGGQVVVEIKSVEHLLDVHHKQVLTYLKLSGFRLGLLVNFCTTEITSNIFRKVNNLQSMRIESA
jgi:GxxExxY protein